MSLFTSPVVRAADANINPLAGALWYFYLTGTTTPANVYTTSARNVAHANPVVADAGGLFAPIYLDPSVTYRAILRTSGGATIQDIDPIAQSSSYAELAASGGSALLGFIQSGTGAVARTAQAKMRDFLHREDFGTLQQAVNAAHAQGKALYLGDTNFTQSTTVTLPDGDNFIFGPGASILTITFTGSGGLFVGSGLTAATNIYVGGFRAVAGAPNCGRPVDIAFASSAGLNDLTAKIADVVAVGDATNYWTGGPRLDNARNTIIDGCYTYGPTSDLTKTIDGFKVEGEATDVKITNCQALSVGIGIDIGGTSEGTFITTFVAVDVRTGIRKLHSGAGEPLVMVSGWHINARERGMVLQGSIQAIVSPGLLFAQNAVAGWTGFEIAAGATNQDNLIEAVIDGQLAGIAASNLTGMLISAGNALQADLKLRGVGTGVNIASGVTNCLIRIDPASDVTSILTGAGITDITNRVTINHPTEGLLEPIVGGALNPDTSSTVAKVIGRRLYGRDTVAGLKQAGEMRATSVDANWVDAILELYGRRGDALGLAARFFGTGSPEGAVTAKVGAIYTRQDGGAGTTLYVKESGTGNTGWVAK